MFYARTRGTLAEILYHADFSRYKALLYSVQRERAKITLSIVLHILSVSKIPLAFVVNYVNVKNRISKEQSALCSSFYKRSSVS